MLHLVELSMEYAGRFLFDSVNVHIRKKDRIGLVGPNGAGKTTLFRILTGSVHPTSGEIRKPKDLRIGYLPQEGLLEDGKTLMAETLTAFEELVRTKKELRRLEKKISDDSLPRDEHDGFMELYGELLHRFEHHGGLTMEAEAGKVLLGLGFTTDDFGRPTAEFSGGWRMRILLAKLLVQKPDLLLLDEPTNHLDLESLQWLESYLSGYDGSVILISHDRTFLNKICVRILELSGKNLTVYTGNYDVYLATREERIEQQRQAYKRQQDYLKQQQLFIDRFRAKNTKATLVQSRIKALEKLDLVEAPEDQTDTVRFRFPPPPRAGRSVVTFEGLTKSYGDNLVFENLGYSVDRGDKIAVVGVNGEGKSTLCRILAGVESSDGGEVRYGHNVVAEYFAQQQAEKLQGSTSVFDEIRKESKDQTLTGIRTLLGAFLFGGDDVDKPVSVLSGGEKSRLALAKMLLRASNFLILDEPTNHIDIQTKDILKRALNDYGGTFLVVSHDRHFLGGLVNKVLELKHGKLREFRGGFEYYLERKAAELEGESAVVREKQPVRRQSSARKTRAQKHEEAEERKKKSAVRKRIADTERRIADLEQKKEALGKLLGDPETYQDPDRVRDTAAEFEAISAELTGLYETWEALVPGMGE